MDQQLISQTRAVKRRRRAHHPTLWLFTDTQRLSDPLAAIARLPRGISGVVFRHDCAPGRAALAKAVARLCRSRRIALVIAGDWRLAAACHAGSHLRCGRAEPMRDRVRDRVRYRGAVTTASAHGRTQIIAAGRNGAAILFLSPAFTTASHEGAAPLGGVRWAAAAKSSRIPVLALGGVTGRSLRRLGRDCAGAGAIAALSWT